MTLTESTIAANTRFFENEAQVPRQAYSMGMQAIMQAKRVLLIASGADKAEAIRNSFFGPVTPQGPGVDPAAPPGCHRHRRRGCSGGLPAEA